MLGGTEVTQANFDEIRERLPRDQARELKVGCLTWTAHSDRSPEMRVITVWPEEGRAAIFHGADSAWGDWDEAARTIRVDVGGEWVTIDEFGDEVDPDGGDEPAGPSA